MDNYTSIIPIKYIHVHIYIYIYICYLGQWPHNRKVPENNSTM